MSAAAKRFNLRNTLYLTLTPLGAAVLGSVHAVYDGVVWQDLALLAFMFVACGMAITAGYHRLLAHRAYQTNPVVEFLLLCFGAASFQGSALIWSTDHRRHHRLEGGAGDPYSINDGFFWAHMGWLLFAADHGREDFSNGKDLLKDRLVVWEHKYYLLIAVAVGYGLPTLIGWTYGRPLAGFLWGGLIRQVLSHHNTFLINSAAHYFGPRPFSLETTARQCWPMGPLAFGEGYHNFHHTFPNDYRNGHRWYHVDPTKWLIWTLDKVKLASRLRRTSADQIQASQDAVAAQLR